MGLNTELSFTQQSVNRADLRQDDFFVDYARFGDFDKILAVVCAAFGSRDTFIKPEIPRVTRHQFEDTFTKRALWQVVVHGDPKIRNIVGAVLMVDESAFEASIHLLSVMPTYHRLGLGALLIQACAEKAFSEGKPRLSLEVTNVKNRLIDYYQTLGFKLTGVVNIFFQPVLKDEWQGNGPDGLPKMTSLEMKKDLYQMKQADYERLVWRFSRAKGYTGDDFEYASNLFRVYQRGSLESARRCYY